MYHFCTLFNHRYLTRGLALYESLKKNMNDDFMLYIFAFDDICYEKLFNLDLANTTIISLAEFETEELLRVKPTRSVGEYCWTCTAATVLYVLQNYSVDMCTYLDSDIYFFNSPKVLIDEIGDDSVIITEHRYTPKYDQTETSGKYCVQFMTFKNDEYGIKVLEWWRDRCIEWCYIKTEDGKHGDQMYLDNWCTMFKKIHELKHIGGGVAPWNVQQYKFENNGDDILMTELATNYKTEVIFFHFAALRFFDKPVLRTTPVYEIPESAVELLYREYFNKLNDMLSKYNLLNDQYDYNFTEKLIRSDIKELVENENYNFYYKDYFIK